MNVCLFVFRSELYGAFYEVTKAPNQKGKTTQVTGEGLVHFLNQYSQYKELSDFLLVQAISNRRFTVFMHLYTASNLFHSPWEYGLHHTYGAARSTAVSMWSQMNLVFPCNIYLQGR